MRPIDPATGKPYPRRHPINWAMVRRVLSWRQADKRIRDDGFERVNAFAGLSWESPHCSHRILEARIHPDGRALYVRTERITPS